MPTQEIQGKKFEILIVEREEGVFIITLNRPEKKNAIGPQGMREIGSALEEAAGDQTVKAVILAGAGDSFCAGADFQEAFGAMAQGMDYNDWKKNIVAPMMKIYKTIAEMEKPVIAAIQGYAVGGGMDIASACDIRIAAEDAQFGEFFVRAAICPEAALFFAPRLMPFGKALLLSMTGDLIDAKEAERIGFVEKVVPREQLLPVAKELAKRLANGPTLAIAAIKKLMHNALVTNLDLTLEAAFDVMYRLIQTEDFKEIVKAFSEKRKPIYKGR